MRLSYIFVFQLFSCIVYGNNELKELYISSLSDKDIELCNEIDQNKTSEGIWFKFLSLQCDTILEPLVTKDSIELCAQQFNEAKDTVGWYLALKILAKRNYRLGDYVRTKEITNQIEPLINIVVRETNLLADIEKFELITDLSAIHFHEGNYELSFKYTEEMISILNNLNSDQEKSRYFVHTGNMLNRLKKHDIAFSYYKRALNLAIQEKDLKTQSSVFSSLGISCASRNKLDSAIYYVNKSIQIEKKLNNDFALGNKYLNLGSIYYFKNMFNESRDQFELALNNGIKYHNNRIIRPALSNLGRVSAKLNQPKKAFAYYDKVLEHQELNNYLNDLITTYSNIHQTYADFSDYENAYIYAIKESKIRDSINTSDVSRFRAEFESKLGLLEKEKEILLLNKQKLIDKNRYQRISSFLITGLITGIACFIAFFFAQKKRLVEKKKKSIELEQRLLRSQMNPHFTFNSLASIQHFLISEGGAQKGAHYLAKFAKLMRQILEQSRTSLITLNEELETLNNYLAIQQLRYDNRFSFSINVDNKLSGANTILPPMLIQPLVENAIEHGRIHTIKDGHVSINISLEDDHVLISVNDNGIGRNAAQKFKRDHKEESVALSIIKERLEIIYNQYKPFKNLMLMDGISNGTVSAFQLPIISRTEFNHAA